MRLSFVCCFIVLNYFAFAQANKDSLMLIEQHSFYNDTLKKLDSSLYEFAKLKNNLLQVIQEEYCFWNEPIMRTEMQDASVQKIKDYWQCLNIKPTTKQVKNFNWQEAHPWSAAFISWCMQKAGYEECFLLSPNHAKYIIWARDNKISGATNHPFWAYSINDKVAKYPVAGDLLCKNREGKNFNLDNIHRYAISHCDVVFDVDYVNGIIITIGGNVADKVNKRWVFLDANGYIDTNAAWLSFDANGIATTGSQQDFFSIIKVQ
jgi:hypothetical protein